jgi:hypothetical protein
LTTFFFSAASLFACLASAPASAPAFAPTFAPTSAPTSAPAYTSLAARFSASALSASSLFASLFATVLATRKRAKAADPSIQERNLNAKRVVHIAAVSRRCGAGRAASADLPVQRALHSAIPILARAIGRGGVKPLDEAAVVDGSRLAFPGFAAISTVHVVGPVVAVHVAVVRRAKPGAVAIKVVIRTVAVAIVVIVAVAVTSASAPASAPAPAPAPASVSAPAPAPTFSSTAQTWILLSTVHCFSVGIFGPRGHGYVCSGARTGAERRVYPRNNKNVGALCLVLDVWCLMFGALFQVLYFWCFISGALYLVLYFRCFIFGALFSVLYFRCWYFSVMPKFGTNVCYQRLS